MAIFNLRWPGKKQQEAQSQRVIRAPRSNPAESVEAMRRRARHRLMGATVLVLLAIIGFPMLFDTQPRPVPVNAAIEIPDRERVAALNVPPAAAVGPAKPAAHGADNGLVAGEEIVSGGAAATAAAVASAAKPAPHPAEKPTAAIPTPAKPEAKPKEAPKPVTKPEAKPEPKEEKPKEPPKPKEEKPKEPAKPKRDEDADRIRAMMEGRQAGAAPAAPAAKPEAAAPTPAPSTRYIIQVGAFAEADKAAEVSAKLQMAGISAFTQSVKTSAGNRVRVRIGPFKSKEEAERAAAKVKAQGLPASLVPL